MFHDAMRVLCDHGLVEIDTSSQELKESRGYSIHGCVHMWTIQVLNQKWDYDLAWTAVRFVATHISKTYTFRPWLGQRRLLQHAARCSYLVFNGLVKDDSTGWAYHNLGKLYGDQGKLYGDQGKLGAAQDMYELALNIKSKSFGPNDKSTLTTANNLGCLYAHQGNRGHAEKIFRQVLGVVEKTLGPNDFLTHNALNNLATIYSQQGNLYVATSMYEQALRGYTEKLGAEHTSTLNTINNLANIYAKWGNLGAAEKMYEHVLRGQEKAMGPLQFTTYVPALNTMENLAVLYAKSKRRHEAEELLLCAKCGIGAVFGHSSKRYKDIDKRLAVLNRRDS
jgi:tetratricopeptide (TPR) repeat protein